MDSLQIKCPGCGASVFLSSAVCRYCAAYLRAGRVLPPEDIDKLRYVVNAMEDSLKSAQGNSRIGHGDPVPRVRIRCQHHEQEDLDAALQRGFEIECR